MSIIGKRNTARTDRTNSSVERTASVSGKDKKPAESRSANRKAKQRKKVVESTQNMSPILEVKDGVIVSKSHHFYKLLEFEPVNFELKSAEEQAAIISQFSGVIKTWPNLVHLKIVSTKSDVTPFINDLEKRKRTETDNGNSACAALLEDQIEMIRRVGKTQGVSRRFFVIIQFDMGSGIRRRPPFSDIVQGLNRQARSIALAMEGCGNLLVSSDDRDYILESLYLMMCKVQAAEIPFQERKANILKRYRAEIGDVVDESMIPVNDMICPDKVDTSLSPQYVMIDGMYAAYCYLPASAYPVQAYGGWLQILFGYLDDVDVDVWIRKEDVATAQRKITSALRTNKLRVYEKGDITQEYDDLMSSINAGYYIKSALANGDDLCYISTIVTVMALTSDDLKARVQEMQNLCIRNDMMLRKCVFQQEEAYISCLPLTEYSEPIFDKSKRNVTASQLGSCYPFTAYELADKGGIFMGVNSRYASPVFLNTFDTSKYQSANMIILGPSGSGKTYTLLCMLLRMRQKGLQVYVIAPLKGHEFRRACEAIGGEYVRIAPGSNQNINVLEIRKPDKGVFAARGMDKGSILSEKIQRLLDFFTVIVPDRTETEKQILDEALKSVYADFGITDSNDSLVDPETGDYKRMPTLSELHAKLRSTGSQGLRLYNALTRYVTGSARSFSMPTNVNLNNQFVVIDVSDLTAEMLPVAMMIALDYVMDKAKENITKRKVIAIDEMWRLMQASRQSAEFVQQIYKEIRGYGGAAIGSTQDLSDVLSSDIGAAVINNARFKILLPMDKKEADVISTVIDLSDEEKNQLKQTSLKTGGGGTRRALLVVNNNHVQVNIIASQREHDLITTNAGDLERQAMLRTVNPGTGDYGNAE